MGATRTKNGFTSEVLKQRLASNKSLAAENPTLGQVQMHLHPGAFPAASAPPARPEGKTATGTPGKPRGRKGMNKTETEFAHMLSAQYQRAEIRGFEFEGMTLRWPDGMVYTPDFLVEIDRIKTNPKYVEGTEEPIVTYVAYRLIEVKGAKIWAKDLVKFRAARAQWPQFQFELWQKTRHGWSKQL